MIQKEHPNFDLSRFSGVPIQFYMKDSFNQSLDRSNESRVSALFSYLKNAQYFFTRVGRTMEEVHTT